MEEGEEPHYIKVTGGSYPGHIIPGVMFIWLAMAHLWDTVKEERQSQGTGRSSHLYHTVTRCSRRCLVSYVAVFLVAFGIWGELYNPGNGDRRWYWTGERADGEQHFYWTMTNFQHSAMYFGFGLPFLFSIVGSTCKLSALQYVQPLFILSFGIEYLVFSMHLDGREWVDTLVHEFLLNAIILCVLTTMGEVLCTSFHPSYDEIGGDLESDVAQTRQSNGDSKLNRVKSDNRINRDAPAHSDTTSTRPQRPAVWVETRGPLFGLLRKGRIASIFLQGYWFLFVAKLLFRTHGPPWDPNDGMYLHGAIVFIFVMLAIATVVTTTLLYCLLSCYYGRSLRAHEGRRGRGRRGYIKVHHDDYSDRGFGARLDNLDGDDDDDDDDDERKILSVQEEHEEQEVGLDHDLEAVRLTTYTDTPSSGRLRNGSGESQDVS